MAHSCSHSKFVLSLSETQIGSAAYTFIDLSPYHKDCPANKNGGRVRVSMKDFKIKKRDRQKDTNPLEL